MTTYHADTSPGSRSHFQLKPTFQIKRNKQISNTYFFFSNINNNQYIYSFILYINLMLILVFTLFVLVIMKFVLTFAVVADVVVVFAMDFGSHKAIIWP